MYRYSATATNYVTEGCDRANLILMLGKVVQMTESRLPIQSLCLTIHVGSQETRDSVTCVVAPIETVQHVANWVGLRIIPPIREI